MGSQPGRSIKGLLFIVSPGMRSNQNSEQIFGFINRVTVNGHLYDILDDQMEDLRHMVNGIQMPWYVHCYPNISTFLTVLPLLFTRWYNVCFAGLET